MVVGDERTKSLDATGTYGHLETSTCLGTPQVTLAVLQACWPGRPLRVQIKNIKLHIVTDIKVNFNSMLGFRISTLVGGMGTFTEQEKFFRTPVDFLFHFRSRVTFVTSTHRAPRDAGSTKMPKSLRHQVFPGGPPSKYYPGPTMLNFRDQTRTGVFIVVWS